MEAAVIQRVWTEEELMALPHKGKTEVVNGELIMSPVGFEHEEIGGNLFLR